VTVKRLNEQVSRNQERFLSDLTFQLTSKEHESLRSQFATSNKTRGGRQYTPHAFTEYGAIMAATVLNSERAVQMSVFVVRAFVRLRDMLGHEPASRRKDQRTGQSFGDERFANSGYHRDHQGIDDAQQKTRRADWIPASAGNRQTPEPGLEASAPKLRRARWSFCLPVI
jgi:hypothetical protein